MATPDLVAALGAALLPARAGEILARHPDPAAAREAAQLVPRPRADRLAAIATALAGLPRPSEALRERAASLERPRLAALLRAGEDLGAARPLLQRIVMEAGWDG